MATDEANSRSFELLHEGVRRWIWSQGWDDLRDIQEQSVPAVLGAPDDLIIAAGTSSGKTEAAFLPLVSAICAVRDEPGRAGGFRAVYVSPLKALINDQFRRLDGMCEDLEIPVHRWHGDVDAARKKRARERPDGILLITPESLEALLVRRGRGCAPMFGPCLAFVIDELHAFIGSERGVQLRSLLTRIEDLVGRRIRRIGLSATLGDMALAAEHMRPGGGGAVRIIESRESRQTVRIQLRGYVKGKGLTQPQENDPDTEDAAEPDADGVAEGGDGDSGVAIDDGVEDRGRASRRTITRHLFETLRGRRGLVFAGARGNVELYTSMLTELCRREGMPDEFFAHHGSLAKAIREEAEARMRDASRPATVLCTSTLELGIDIGDVEAVGQVGAPFSVASLRQRLGRSGRRKGQAAVLRLYVAEPGLAPQTHPLDRLRRDTVRSAAAVRLLLARWCEPPRRGMPHLSTLLHQTLALIAQDGGVSAGEAFALLCRSGVFPVDGGLYKRLLRRMREARLIEQAPDGTLLLGEVGEQLVEDRSFYAVFNTPDEYAVLHRGKQLGQLPVEFGIVPRAVILFAGRRWRVMRVDGRARTIDVEPASGGKPPVFGGEPGPIHDRLVAEMRAVWEAQDEPAWLNPTALALLREGRDAYAALALDRSTVIRNDGIVLLPWVGTVGLNTLAVALGARGLQAAQVDIALEIKDAPERDVAAALEAIASAPPPDAAELAAVVATKAREKHDALLGEDLLCIEYAARSLDAEGLPAMAAAVLAGFDAA